jgi:hypothetical protein
VDEAVTEAVTTPAVSVVVPTYNAAPYVREALASVLAQDFTEFELLVIDDGSTDGTAAVLQEFAADPRVRLLRNERNMGLIATLHRAYGKCSAPLIARMDSDDVCEPTRFRRQVQFLRSHPDVSLVGGAIRFFGNVAPNVFSFPLTHEGIRPAMLFYCPLAHPALMFRRELVASGLLRYDDAFKHAEDYHLWSRLLLKARAANLPEVVLHYRLHAQQVSSDSSDKQYQASLRVRGQMLQEAGALPTDEEVELHESVILEKPLPRPDYLGALGAWFARLEEANARSNYWDADALHALLRGKFRDTAVRTGSDLSAVAAAPVTQRYVSAEEARHAREAGTIAPLPTRIKRHLKALLWRISAARGR